MYHRTIYFYSLPFLVDWWACFVESDLEFYPGPLMHSLLLEMLLLAFLFNCFNASFFHLQYSLSVALLCILLPWIIYNVSEFRVLHPKIRKKLKGLSSHVKFGSIIRTMWLLLWKPRIIASASEFGINYIINVPHFRIKNKLYNRPWIRLKWVFSYEEKKFKVELLIWDKHIIIILLLLLFK